MKALKFFNNYELNDLINLAGLNRRKRTHSNIHDSYDEPSQKLFNAINIESYIRPHRHVENKKEFLIALSGLMTVFMFDDNGVVVESKNIAPYDTQNDINSCFAVTIAPNVWHTVVARKDNSILLEVKDGPFDPSIAKEYSDWSPSEDSKMANNYLIKLKKII
jgi:cupin fold WbuC family metalloprotein